MTFGGRRRLIDGLKNSAFPSAFFGYQKRIKGRERGEFECFCVKWQSFFGCFSAQNRHPSNTPFLRKSTFLLPVQPITGIEKRRFIVGLLASLLQWSGFSGRWISGNARVAVAFEGMLVLFEKNVPKLSFLFINVYLCDVVVMVFAYMQR